MTPSRVLITRPRPDAAPVAALLAAQGLTPVVEPMMEVVTRPGPPLRWNDVQAVALTSANGARALAQRDGRRDLPVFAVGPATAAAARDLGFTTVLTAGGHVDRLAADLIAHLDPAAGAVCHVAGATVAGDLAGRLRRAGLSCRQEVLYDARAVAGLSPAAAGLIRSGGIAAVLLFSPRTATLFADHVRAAGLGGACGTMVAACLSDRVAAAVGSLSWRAVAIAPHPDQAALVERTLRYLTAPLP